MRTDRVAAIPGDDSGMMLATSFAKAMPGDEARKFVETYAGSTSWDELRQKTKELA